MSKALPLAPPYPAGVTTPLDRLGLDDLRKRTSIKWRQYADDVLPLWVAEMDVTLAEPITNALRDAVDRHDTGYPMPDTYVDAFAAFAAARWDWTFEPDSTSIVGDVMTGLVAVIRLVTQPGDAVVVNSPVYTPFYWFVTRADRHVVESPLTADHRIDLDGLERVFAEQRPSAYLLCSPHNPTGTVHTRAELASVVGLAERYAVRVVVDEIHSPVVFPEHPHTPFLTVDGSERHFSLVSASKAWNLPGLKAALAVAGPGATDDLHRLPPETTHGPTQFGVIAHEAAWREGGPWLEDLLVGLDRNRRLLGDLLYDLLPEMGYRMPQATYLAWLDCRRLELGPQPAERFLEQRVALSEGRPFGTGGEGHVRLNLATSTEILTEAVHRMAKAIR